MVSYDFPLLIGIIILGLIGIEIPNDLEIINSNHHWGFCLVGLILQVMGMGTHWGFFLEPLGSI